MITILLTMGEGRSLACIAVQHVRGLPISQARNQHGFEVMKK